jgi:hypothetical protein
METHLANSAAAAYRRSDHPADDALIGQAEARRLAGSISDMTMWRWRQAGIIAEPITIRRRNYWRRGEFLAAIQAAAAREGCAA